MEMSVWTILRTCSSPRPPLYYPPLVPKSYAYTYAYHALSSDRGWQFSETDVFGIAVVRSRHGLYIWCIPCLVFLGIVTGARQREGEAASDEWNLAKNIKSKSRV